MSDSTKKNILEWIYCIVIAIILALLIKFFILSFFEIFVISFLLK